MNFPLFTTIAASAVRDVRQSVISCQHVIVRGGFGLFMMTIVCGCDDTREATTPERQDPTEVEMVAAMEQHYTTAILAHDALIQGDVEAFRSQLTQLDALELPANAPDSWKSFDVQLHAAASQANEVTDLATAANAMASVALACGSCHQGTDSGPVYPVPPVVEQGQPLKDAMGMHEWATQMLWNGVTGPSDYAWERGSEDLAATQIFGNGKSIDKPGNALLEREAALRALGEEAKSTTALATRAEVYGRMLVTCGACHQEVGVKLHP